MIDFDLNSAIINPQYALPLSNGAMKEIILHRDERIARLSFTTMSNALKFQQSITGYKAWASYTQFNVMVSFVIANRKEPIVERASIQLWIPKAVDGSLVTNADVAAEANNGSVPTRSSTMATNTTSGAVPIPQQIGRAHV